MARYHLRQRSKRQSKFSQNLMRFPSKNHKLMKKSSKSGKSFKDHQHPYATRSKTSRLPDSSKKSQKSVKNNADSHVIYLGAFRKIPWFVDLENNVEKPQCTALIENFQPKFQLKVEKTDCMNQEI